MYFEPELEKMRLEDIKNLQEERLKKVVKYCYQKIPMYRRKFKECGIDPDDIKGLNDLSKIPFTVKDDLRAHYPYGIQAVPLSEIVRFHASSGTTGKPTVVSYTRKDIETWSRLMARGLVTAGVTKEDILQISYGYGLFTGGLGFHYGAELLGCKIIPASAGGTKRQVTLMRDMGSTALACTPSYSLYLAEVAKEEGVDPKKDLKLRIGIFGAEPWSEAARKKIEDALNLTAIDVYGLSEIWGPGVAMECEEQRGLHVWGDHFIAEIIDPETGEILESGERGELVFTTLTREAVPLLRFRSRDISVIDEEECACGRYHPRMLRVQGRSDDMLIIRGVNVFPSQIEQVLMKIPGIGENYQIIVDKDILDRLLVKVEVTEETFSDKLDDLIKFEKKVESELEDVLGVSTEVELVEPGSIPRSEGKAVRVIDLRKEKLF
ncbi:MAG: phenylacetate--CoA ligase family protein [Candidatus Hydrothermarchaeota archaeon]